jgi:hypothetical protein
MKNTDIPQVIYNIGDLKAAFTQVRAERVRAMQKDILPKGSVTSLLSSSPSQDLAVEVTKSLGLLANFNDDQYIGLTGALCELGTSSDKPSKPFHAYFVANDYRTMTKDQAKAYPNALCQLR